MTLFPILMLALLSLAIYTGYFKLAAFLLRRTQLSWAKSFTFAVVLFLVVLGFRGVSALAPQQIPSAAIAVAAPCAALLLGTWFFDRYARTASGARLGWGRGLALTLIGAALLVATGLLLILAMQGLRR